MSEIAPKLNTRPEPKRKRFEDAPPTPWSLSGMEFQVVALLRDGRTFAQIAQTIHVAKKTAEVYAMRARAKMGAATTAQMVVLLDRWERAGKPAPLEVVLTFRDGKPSVQMRELV